MIQLFCSPNITPRFQADSDIYLIMVGYYGNKKQPNYVSSLSRVSKWGKTAATTAGVFGGHANKKGLLTDVNAHAQQTSLLLSLFLFSSLFTHFLFLYLLDISTAPLTFLSSSPCISPAPFPSYCLLYRWVGASVEEYGRLPSDWFLSYSLSALGGCSPEINDVGSTKANKPPLSIAPSLSVFFPKVPPQLCRLQLSTAVSRSPPLPVSSSVSRFRLPLSPLVTFHFFSVLLHFVLSVFYFLFLFA